MEDTLNSVLSDLLALAGIILVSVMSWAAKKLADKYGIEVDVGTEARYRHMIRGLIGRAEEEVRARSSRLAEGEELSPEERDKLAMVLRWAKEKIPALSDSELTSMIHEELSFIPGVGATGNDLSSRG